MNRNDLQGSVLPLARRQVGVTLVELMISMAIGLSIVLTVTTLLVSAKSSYVHLDDDVQMQATGRYALEILARAVRQASYVDSDVAQSLVGASFAGLDARSLKSRTPGIESPLAKSVNGSDVLAIRFWGSGTGGNGDGTMIDCAGFGIAAQPGAADSRGWSVFYVAEDATGEPELYCKYQGESGWSAQAIARGVESFQVMYGLDTDGDGLPNRFVNATVINALDEALVLAGTDPVEQAADRLRKTHWKRVVGVRVALLMRGTHAAGRGSVVTEYDLFGRHYANAFSDEDVGTRLREADLPKQVQGRKRRIFEATVYLPSRTAQPGGGAL